jgi:ubiquitin C-terminal hydrolase
MEFFTYLLDRLHEEMLSGQETLEIPFNRDDEFSIPSLPAATVEEEEWEEVGRAGAVNHVDQVSRKNAVMLNNSTIISSVFHGTLRSEVKYPNKKATSVSFQRFHCLSLDLTLPSSSSSSHHSLELQTALDAYFAEEVSLSVLVTPPPAAVNSSVP